jgi:hypothetical protein
MPATGGSGRKPIPVRLLYARLASPRPTLPLGWQPSRFLTDRTEAERAFQLAEQLGSVNAAIELGTTWPSLRKAFTRHGLGMPVRNPKLSAMGYRRRPPAQRPAGHPDPGSCVRGAQPWRPPGPRAVTG